MTKIAARPTHAPLMPMSDTYTAITFAPIQGFIEKSRKLRDLYGSSYILSFLSWSICAAATQHKHTIISPAAPNLTQGMPNQIIIQGDLSKAIAQAAFNQAWRSLVFTCRDYISQKVPADYTWNREWSLWAAHAWEFFHATGPTVTSARQRLNDTKQQRNWTGINWTGESSTLSGSDGIAWPQLGAKNPNKTSAKSQKDGIESFYTALSAAVGEAFIDPDEELSIPELVKRIVTREDVAKAIVQTLKQRSGNDLSKEDEAQLTAIAHQLNPETFKDLNRLKRKNPKAGESEEQHWTGWFLGDGDKAGDHIQSLEPHEITDFSAQMREWGLAMYEDRNNYMAGSGRMIYAGGDDFMGVLYERDRQIPANTCFDWMSKFNRDFWQGDRIQSSGKVPLKHKGGDRKPITVSVGFVWAAPNVPQRDVLQNCREAEQSAKGGGRDRIAFRILFNGGNYLEWVCPWWVLEAGHINISRNSLGLAEPQAWTHLYNDIAALESRHAFGSHQDSQTEVAQALFQLYFGSSAALDPKHWWNSSEGETPFSGLLGNPSRYTITDPQDPEYHTPLNENRFVKQAINRWVINLAKVGFHLTRGNSEPPFDYAQGLVIAL